MRASARRGSSDCEGRLRRATARYVRADLESHPAGDLEPDVATRPASSAAAAAAAAAAACWHHAFRRHGAGVDVSHTRRSIARRPFSRAYQHSTNISQRATLQQVDWHTGLRHICSTASRSTASSRRSVVVAQWPPRGPHAPGHGQRDRRPVHGTASERDQRHRAIRVNFQNLE